jgi:hypothetical protein
MYLRNRPTLATVFDDSITSITTDAHGKTYCTIDFAVLQLEL